MKKHIFALLSLNILLLATFWVTEITSKRFGAAPDSHDALSWAVATSVSRDVYGVGGYIGYAKVLDYFWESGFSARGRLGFASNPDDHEARPFADMVWNVERNNEILAGSLKLDLPEGGEAWGNNKLFATPANDVGYVDLISLGFSLFGYRMESLQLIYMLLYTVGALAFLGLFRSDPTYLSIGALFLLSMLMLSDGILFTGDGNVVQHHNQRFLDTLAVLPAISLVAARYSLDRRLDLGLIAVQIAMIVMAIHFRSSSNWVLIPMVLIAILTMQMVRERLHFRIVGPTLDALSSVISSSFRNGLLALIGILVVTRVITGMFTSTVYQTGVVIPHHMFWHNLYIGLSYHPDWVDKMGHRTNGKSRTDDTAWTAGINRASSYYGIPANYYQNYLGNSFGHMNKGLHEVMIKEEYLTTLFSEPRLAVELYLWYKPIMTVKKYVHVLGTTLGNISLISAFMLILTLAALFFSGLNFRDQYRNGFYAVSAIMLGSLIPIFFTYPYEGLLGSSSWLLLVWILMLPVFVFDLVKRRFL